jgi:hypothetical protein
MFAENVALLISAISGVIVAVGSVAVVRGRKEAKAGAGASAEAVLNASIKDNPAAVEACSKAIVKAVELNTQAITEGNRIAAMTREESRLTNDKLNSIHLDMFRGRGPT